MRNCIWIFCYLLIYIPVLIGCKSATSQLPKGEETTPALKVENNPSILGTEKFSLPEKNFTMEMTYRGKERIMQFTENRGIKTRGFLVGGQMVAAETDEDSDGFFETLTIFDPTRQDYEIFIRRPDHTIQPLDPGAMAEKKRQYNEANKALSEVLRSSSEDAKK